MKTFEKNGEELGLATQGSVSRNWSRSKLGRGHLNSPPADRPVQRGLRSRNGGGWGQARGILLSTWPLPCFPGQAPPPPPARDSMIPRFQVVNRCIKQPFPFKALQTRGRRAYRPSGPLFGNVCAHNKPDRQRFITVFISRGWFGLPLFYHSTPSAPLPPTLQSYRFMVSGRARDWGRGGEEAESKVWAWSRG